MLTRTMQFSLGTWIQISEVVPLLSEPFAVTATPVPDQPESPTFCTLKL